MNTDTAIQVRGLRKRYGAVTAVDGIDSRDPNAWFLAFAVMPQW
jgi:hypothetical protein